MYGTQAFCDVIRLLSRIAAVDWCLVSSVPPVTYLTVVPFTQKNFSYSLHLMAPVKHRLILKNEVPHAFMNEKEHEHVSAHNNYVVLLSSM